MSGLYAGVLSGCPALVGTVTAAGRGAPPYEGDEWVLSGTGFRRLGTCGLL